MATYGHFGDNDDSYIKNNDAFTGAYEGNNNQVKTQDSRTAEITGVDNNSKPTEVTEGQVYLHITGVTPKNSGVDYDINNEEYTSK